MAPASNRAPAVKRTQVKHVKAPPPMKAPAQPKLSVYVVIYKHNSGIELYLADNELLAWDRIRRIISDNIDEVKQKELRAQLRVECTAAATLEEYQALHKAWAAWQDRESNYPESIVVHYLTVATGAPNKKK